MVAAGVPVVVRETVAFVTGLAVALVAVLEVTGLFEDVAGLAVVLVAGLAVAVVVAVAGLAVLEVAGLAVLEVAGLAVLELAGLAVEVVVVLEELLAGTVAGLVLGELVMV